MPRSIHPGEGRKATSNRLTKNPIHPIPRRRPASNPVAARSLLREQSRSLRPIRPCPDKPSAGSRIRGRGPIGQHTAEPPGRKQDMSVILVLNGQKSFVLETTAPISGVAGMRVVIGIVFRAAFDRSAPRAVVMMVRNRQDGQQPQCRPYGCRYVESLSHHRCESTDKYKRFFLQPGCKVQRPRARRQSGHNPLSR